MCPLIFNKCHVQGKAHLNLPYDETQQDLKCSNGFRKFILVDQDTNPNKDYYKFVNLNSSTSNIEVENGERNQLLNTRSLESTENISPNDDIDNDEIENTCLDSVRAMKRKTLYVALFLICLLVISCFIDYCPL